VTYSLRRTLAVRFAVTMGVALAATSGALYWGTSVVLRRQLDQALAAAAYLSEGHMRAAEPRVPTWLAGAPAEYEALVNRYIVLRDRDGAVLHAAPDTAASLPLHPAALEGAARGEPVWVSGLWHGRGVRSVYLAVPHEGIVGDAVLQVTALLRPLQLVQRDLSLALLAVVLCGAAATFFGAWHLGAAAARPVAEITGQATRIEAGTLDQRIVAHAEAEEYRGLVAVLNRMLERLERAFRAQRRMTADMSHELRTPLTALRGEVEVALRTERSPAAYRQVLRSALEEIDRLTALTEDLLLVTRAEGHVLEPRLVATDLNGLVQRSLDRVRDAAERKDLVLDPAFDAAAGAVLLDEALASRLLGSLLENAVQFTPQGGRVRVATRRADGRVQITIEDSGPGIAAQDLPHVFEPFYRADPARGRGGSGLGLCVAAAIARVHGGAIAAATLPAGGTRFAVDLPVASPP
jgi:heavy metal sensor kinase